MTINTAGSDVMMFDLASGAATGMTTEGAQYAREWFRTEAMLYRTDRGGGAEPYTIWGRPSTEASTTGVVA
jgi:hypothetical protein